MLESLPYIIDSNDSTQAHLTLRPKAAVLFTNFPFIGSESSVSSQFFVDLLMSGTPFWTAAADDITVPNGQAWRIEEVAFKGAGGSSVGEPWSVNLYIMAEAGGLPSGTDLAADALFAYPEVGFFENPATKDDFRVVLPTAAVLGPGTYWIVYQASMPVGPIGDVHNRTESSLGADTGLINGNESAWMQSHPIFTGLDNDPDCVLSWGRRITDCGMSRLIGANFEYDLSMEVLGTVLVPGVSLEPATLHTSEDGTADTFSVALTAPPTGNVIVPIGAGPPAFGVVSPTSLTFTPADWAVPQIVTVTPVDDAVPEPTQFYSLLSGPTTSLTDPAFNGLPIPPVSVFITDDDGPAILVNPANGILITENGPSGSFDIRLATPLGAGETVTVPLSYVPAVVTGPPSVTFTAADGTHPITVTLTKANDDIASATPSFDFMVITGDPTSATNATYDAFTAIQVGDTRGICVDDDRPGFDVVVPDGIPITVTEAGSTATFSVELTSEPTAPVVVDLFSTSSREATVSPMSLTFTAGDWNTPQNVTVTGVDAEDWEEGDQQFETSTQYAVSVDPNYSDRDPANVRGINIDDDTADVDYAPAPNVTVSESGTVAAVDVVLTARPRDFATAKVTDLTLGTLDPGELIVSDDGISFGNSITLGFPSASWNVPQRIYVRGVDDPFADGSMLSNLCVTNIDSFDVAFVDKPPGDFTCYEVETLDDEIAAVNVAPAMGLTVDEGGGQASFQVSLASPPPPAVTVLVPIASGDTSEILVSTNGSPFQTSGSLSFTDSDWNISQTVDLEGQPDAIIDGPQIATVVTGDVSGVGSVYESLVDADVADVTVTNLDLTVAGISILGVPPEGLLVSEDGLTDSFQVVLGAQPAPGTTVEIPLISTDSSEGMLSVDGGSTRFPSLLLQFAPADWDQPQTVTLVGEDDGEADGDLGFMVVTGDPVSGDPAFDGLGDADIPDVPAINLDNESVIAVPALGPMGLVTLVMLLAFSAIGILWRRT